MENKLIALKALLDELGIPETITTIDDRKRVQKGVYLGQLSGVDLGYRFGWYVLGPYCAALTKDYYSLAEAIASGDRSYVGMKFSDGVRERLRSIAPLMNPPNSFPLAQEDWLELVSSLHYLKRVVIGDASDALVTLRKAKPHLYPYWEDAAKALRKAGKLS
jgi:hypothetical protein